MKKPRVVQAQQPEVKKPRIVHPGERWGPPMPSSLKQDATLPTPSTANAESANTAKTYVPKARPSTANATQEVPSEQGNAKQMEELLLHAVEDLQVRVGLQQDVLESVVSMSNLQVESASSSQRVRSSCSKPDDYNSYKRALQDALKHDKNERKGCKREKKVRGQTLD